MKLMIAAAMAVCALGASARGGNTAQIQGVEFNVDTVSHWYIGPGVAYSHLRFSKADGTRSFNAFVIDYDRTATGADRVVPKVEIGCDSVKTAERITSIAARKTTGNAQYLAAINGDFFITSSFASQHALGNQILGFPNTTCIVDNKLAAPDIIDKASRENCLVMCTDGNMYIDATNMKYHAMNVARDTVISATAGNFPRLGGDFVIYNSFNGRYTRTDATGREITLKMAKGSKWGINTRMKFVATTDWKNGGNSRIEDDEVVLSVGPDYTNKYSNWLNGLGKGDTVLIRTQVQLPAFENVKPKIREVIGGDVRILKENVTTTEAIRWINTPSALYSRSLVGYSQDRNHLVMCAVDVYNSSGVSYYEGADLMRYLGCWDALDLDGGGSTALWTSAHGMMSTLRDGSERAVGNGLFIRLNAPKDDKVASIRFRDHRCTLPRYGLYEPVVYGYNQYGQLVNTDVKGFTLSAPAELGDVTDGGNALLASGSGTHALKASLDGMECSLAVTVADDAAAQPRVASVLLDNITPWTIELQATVGKDVMAVAPQAYSWESSDVSVATVDADGRITGLRDGTAAITGVNPSGQSTSLNVTVECPTALLQPIFTGTDASAWKISGSGIKNGTATIGADGSLNVNFTVSSTRGTYIKLTREGRLWSRPAGLQISGNSGTCEISKAIVEMQPESAAKAAKHTSTAKIGAGQDFTLVPRVEDFSADGNGNSPLDGSDIATFPASFKSITLYLSVKTGAHSLKIKNIDSEYARINGVGNIASDASADANAPVEYYNLQGMRVLPDNLAPGLYIRRQGSRAAKILVK